MSEAIRLFWYGYETEQVMLSRFAPELYSDVMVKQTCRLGILVLLGKRFEAWLDGT